MRFLKALLLAIKYHTLAIVPTLLGLGVAAAGLWFGIGQPLVQAVQQGSLLSPRVLEVLMVPTNLLLAVGGIVGGFFVRRVGRTTLLFRTQGQVADARVEAAIDEAMTTPEPVSESEPDSASDDQVSELDSGSGPKPTSADGIEPKPATAQSGSDSETAESELMTAETGSESAPESGTEASADEGDGEYDELGFTSDEPAEAEDPLAEQGFEQANPENGEQ